MFNIGVKTGSCLKLPDSYTLPVTIKITISLYSTLALSSTNDLMIRISTSLVFSLFWQCSLHDALTGIYYEHRYWGWTVLLSFSVVIKRSLRDCQVSYYKQSQTYFQNFLLRFGTKIALTIEPRLGLNIIVFISVWLR